MDPITMIRTWRGQHPFLVIDRNDEGVMHMNALIDSLVEAMEVNPTPAGIDAWLTERYLPNDLIDLALDVRVCLTIEGGTNGTRELPEGALALVGADPGDSGPGDSRPDTPE
jgi:hypothetical protein